MNRSKSVVSGCWTPLFGIRVLCVVLASVVTVLPGCEKEVKPGERPQTEVSVIKIEPKDMPVPIEFVADGA